MSTETKKEKKLRNYKIKKALLISGIALLAVQLVATVVFMVILSKVRIVPKDYVIMIDVLLVLILIGRNDNPEVGTAGNYNKDYITSFIRRAYCGFCVS